MKQIDFKIKGYNVNGICVGCLNYNRKMFYHEDIKECFSTLANIDIPDSLSVQLCWECLASVRRAWQFRSQLLKSYNLLKFYSGKRNFLNSLSVISLSQYSTTRLGLSEVEINEDTKFQPVLLKEDIDSDTDQVKLELEDELADFETLNTEDQIFDHDVDLQLENFSQEPEPSSEDDLQLSKLKQKKERKKVTKRGKSDEEEVLHLHKKRKLDSGTEKEILKSQAPLKITNKDEENMAQNEYNKKIPDFKISRKKIKTPIITIMPINETTTSNINSDTKNSKIEANSNERVIAPNNICICDVCKKKYPCKSLLDNHIKKWHTIEIDSEPNPLTDSNTNYQNSNTNLLKGKDALKNKNVTESSHCSKCFSVNGNLTTHVSIHTGEKPYKCSYCTKSFNLSSTLDTHVRSNCSKGFSDNGNLATHVKNHTGEKPYKCSYCIKCFTTISRLATHVRIHTGEKPYKCSYCTKSFNRPRNLNTHVRIHTGEQLPYKCTYCTKSFTYNGDLAKHVRIHTGEKPYKCTYCTKCFTRSDNLVSHVRIHTGEKPHKCSYCTKCFARRSNLVDHVRINHIIIVEEPHDCSFCAKCFTRRNNLVDHVKRSNTGEKPH